MLGHERLDVYRASLELVSESLAIADRLPRGSAAIADQLRRAAVSVPLNIAEAMGRSTRDDRQRHLTIARGSAMECGALFDVIALLPGGDVSARERKALVERIVAMLTKLGARVTEPEHARSSSSAWNVLVPVPRAACRVPRRNIRPPCSG